MCGVVPVTFRKDGPPKAPGNGWTLFYVEYLKTSEKIKHPSEVPGRVRAAAAKWRAMPEAEKQVRSQTPHFIPALLVFLLFFIFYF